MAKFGEQGKAATFGWLCVETFSNAGLTNFDRQPPSGGCVLKLCPQSNKCGKVPAATFGWLCVETFDSRSRRICAGAATFGWLCVETHNVN